MPLSNLVPRGFGFVHHSIAILYHQVPNLSITIRNFFIAVQQQQPQQPPRACSAAAGDPAFVAQAVAQLLSIDVQSPQVQVRVPLAAHPALPVLTGFGGAQAGSSRRKLSDLGLSETGTWQSPAGPTKSLSKALVGTINADA